jgi:hypothetical protein
VDQIQNSRHEHFYFLFLNMVFQSECRKGYMSVFNFLCKMCNISSYFTSENIQYTNNYLSIDKAIVNGSLAIGTNFFVLKLISIVINYL